MSTLTRKQREIQQREAKILEVARQMLLEHGYHGLSMDRIAELLEYSKGTIYHHFPCKEEILMALANQALESRLAMFRRAAAFRGRPRERIMAVGQAYEAFVRLYPHHFQVEQVIRLSSVWQKTSHERRESARICDTACMGVVGGIVRDAVAAGDLDLRSDVAPEHLVFGLWTMAFGAFTLLASGAALDELGIPEPIVALRHNYNSLLDGYGWRPLSGELDQQATIERINREVLAEEMQQLAVLGR
ncbi:MAG TPA: TetR/AcrR family transcriptional regulator [Pirellulales bacterium]|nr:TetR/AcrR family transcriptional regulator [Pirellulales bacterium]